MSGELFLPRHYTRLSALLSILESGALALADPAKWTDRNDFASVEAFRRGKGVKGLGVLCFAFGPESSHHWARYAEGDGCCIMFDGGRLLERIAASGLLHGEVRYYSVEDLTAAKLRAMGVDALPFIKRRPYECESEYRVVWAGERTGKGPVLDVGGCIDCVTLSADFNPHAAGAVERLLNERYKTKTKRSRLLASDQWISKFKNLK